MQPANAPARYHALDSLRGVMMLLGIYLHVICAYSNFPDVWWYKDARTSLFFDHNLLFIHIWRLPVFFVMAGFFAALLNERRGTGGFALNRAKRVLAPFVLGLAVLWPLLQGLRRYTRVWNEPDAVWTAVAYVFRGTYWKWLDPTHLWFLEVLLVLYVLALAFLPLARRIDETFLSGWIHRAFRAVVESAWRPVVFAVPTFGTLCLMNLGVLDTLHSFAPAPRVVLAYGVFFGFGWLLYAHADLLPSFQKHAWKQVVAALLLGWPNFWFLLRHVQARPAVDALGLYGTAATGALAVWLMIFGCTGLFLRYVDRPIPRMRYLSDSSYWLYLFHPPVVFWSQILVAGLAWPAWGKAVVSLAISVPLLLASYHFLVRPTWIGALLNGRRHPRKPVTGYAIPDLPATRIWPQPE